MTIAVGILASDGVVLAADSQETLEGYWKRDAGKIGGRSLAFVHNQTLARRACLISTSGRAGYCDNLMARISKQVARDEEGPLTIEQLEARFNATISEFQKEHVQPYRDHPDVSALIVAQSESRTGLWGSDRGALTSYDHYFAIGIGSGHALSLMSRLCDTSRPLDVIGTAVLASFIVEDTKDNVDGCGEHTDIGWLSSNTFGMFTRKTSRQIEDVFDEFRDLIEPSFLGYVCDQKDGKRPHFGIAAAKLRKRIRALVKDLRSFSPPNMPEKAKSQ